MKNFSQAFAKRCPSLWQKPSRGRPPFSAKNGLRTPGGSFDSAAAGSRPARLGAFERPSMRPRRQDAAGSMPAQGSNGIKLAEARLGKKIRFTPSGENAAELFMTSLEKRFEFETPSPDGMEIQDQGGARSGRERRQSAEPRDGDERRSGKDRRRGFDRRSGIERRRSGDRRNGRYFRDGEMVERRDAFRRRVNGT